MFNAKSILLEEQYWYYLTHSWKVKGIHTFPKGICRKVNVIARLEFELAHYDSADRRFNDYTPHKMSRIERNQPEVKKYSIHNGHAKLCDLHREHLCKTKDKSNYWSMTIRNIFLFDGEIKLTYLRLKENRKHRS